MPAGTGEAGHLAGARKISLAAKHTASLQLLQLVATRRDWMRVPNLKILSPRQRGVEAGRAHHCITLRLQIGGLPIYTAMAYLSRWAP